MTSLDIVFGYDAASICERMTALLAARDFDAQFYHLAQGKRHAGKREGQTDALL